MPSFAPPALHKPASADLDVSGVGLRNGEGQEMAVLPRIVLLLGPPSKRDPGVFIIMSRYRFQ